MAARAAFDIGGRTIAPGRRETVDLPVSVLSNHTPINLPVHVVHGTRSGPTLFVCAAIHGDEILGVEIIRRLLRSAALRRIRGTLLCVPIVNAYGFIGHSRYLPDRRDLNRSFPGTARGSLAAQLANLFVTEIVDRSSFGIDLHSAAVQRVNLPQIRVSPGQERALEMAKAFGAPVVITSDVRAGSMRATACERGVDMLLYEAGEGLRFDEFAIRVGVSGILRVMRGLEMIRPSAARPSKVKPAISGSSSWVRAPAGGILRAYRAIGDSVGADELLGVISDPFGEVETEIRSRDAGLLIGRTQLPVVNQGDALFHVARVGDAAVAGDRVERIAEAVQADPMFDEDEIL